MQIATAQIENCSLVGKAGVQLSMKTAGSIIVVRKMLAEKGVHDSALLRRAIALTIGLILLQGMLDREQGIWPSLAAKLECPARRHARWRPGCLRKHDEKRWAYDVSWPKCRRRACVSSEALRSPFACMRLRATRSATHLDVDRKTLRCCLKEMKIVSSHIISSTAGFPACGRCRCAKPGITRLIAANVNPATLTFHALPC